MRKKKIIIPSLGAAFAALAITVGLVVQAQLPVSAAALTQNSLDKVSSLSDAEEQSLNSRLDGNAEDLLKAARQARDLRVYTYEEFLKTSEGQAPLPPQGAGKDNTPLTELQYLVYTDKDRVTHIIGVDKDDLPVLMMAANLVGSEKKSADDGTGGGNATSVELGESNTSCFQEQGASKPTCTTTEQ